MIDPDQPDHLLVYGEAFISESLRCDSAIERLRLLKQALDHLLLASRRMTDNKQVIQKLEECKKLISITESGSISTDSYDPMSQSLLKSAQDYLSKALLMRNSKRQREVLLRQACLLFEKSKPAETAAFLAWGHALFELSRVSRKSKEIEKIKNHPAWCSYHDLIISDL